MAHMWDVLHSEVLNILWRTWTEWVHNQETIQVQNILACIVGRLRTLVPALGTAARMKDLSNDLLKAKRLGRHYDPSDSNNKKTHTKAFFKTWGHKRILCYYEYTRSIFVSPLNIDTVCTSPLVSTTDFGVETPETDIKPQHEIHMRQVLLRMKPKK